MAKQVILLLAVFCCCTASTFAILWGNLDKLNEGPTIDTITYQTKYFEERLDHFDFQNTQTFKLRYLYNDQYWDKENGGPIFIYAGNEGNIEMFCNNTGFMWQSGHQFKAMIVFPEHRFYGETLPFGKDTYKDNKNLRFLTSEQALADYAELIRHIKKTVDGAQNSKVVVFGGSYGGVLAAWLRMKYPNVVVGAVTSGAPVWGFKDLTTCNSFPDYTTKVWRDTNPVCERNINRVYQTLDTMAAQDKGLETISEAFNMCKPMKTALDLMMFKGLLGYTYVNYAWVNYPYPATFLSDLPGWPIRAACKNLDTPLEGEQLLAGLSKVLQLFYNSEGEHSCFDVQESLTGGELQVSGFLYQICTELSFPLCSDGSGVFMKLPENMVDGICLKIYNVTRRSDWASLQFWGKDLEAASNIIFSNGDLDPTTAFGVTHDISDSVVAIMVKGGAHHLEFRWEHEKDPMSVHMAKWQINHIIGEWLGHYGGYRLGVRR